jgi:hypothetical protein
MMLMSMWYAILVPFFIIMMVVGSSHQNTHDSDEEIEVDNTYQGEEEGVDRPFSTGGQLMCHEVCIIRCKYVEDSIGSIWAFDAPAQNFVNEISAPLRGLIM